MWMTGRAFPITGSKLAHAFCAFICAEIVLEGNHPSLAQLWLFMIVIYDTHMTEKINIKKSLSGFNYYI
jgi:hypothetical protein